MLAGPRAARGLRVVILTNFVAPYRIPLFEALAREVGELRILVSTNMERNRPWRVSHGTLSVLRQRSLTFRPWHSRDPQAWRPSEIHVPYDTLLRLWRYRPDIVVSGELGARSLFAVIHRLLHPRVPLMIWATLSEHTEHECNALRRVLRRLILHGADGILVHGESAARYVHHFGAGRARVLTVNQVVDGAAFASAVRPPGPPRRLLYSGMLVSQKGVDRFADALCAWAQADPARRTEIWWLGDGALRPRLEHRALPANLAQRFLGWVQYEALPQVYQACDILVLPSLRDEWGLVVNEAMAAGMPVLGSRYSQAVTELVTEGETGWIFDPASPASITDAIERALSVPAASLQRMRERAVARVRELTPAHAAAAIAAEIAHLASIRRRCCP